MQTNTHSDTVKFLKDIDRKIQSAEVESDRLQQYLAGLHAVRETMSEFVLTNAAKKQRVQTTSSRTDLIKAILAKANKPVTMDDIMEQLHERGRQDDRPNVHATMSHVTKAGLAKKVGRGTWAPVKERGAAEKAA